MPQIFRRKLLKHGGMALTSFSIYHIINLLRDPSVTATENLINNFERQIPKLMQTALIPGLSLAIIRDGKLFWSQGFGVKNLSTKQPVDNQTVFAAASLTKPLFAYAVLKMVERGQLDLDTPLTKYTEKPYISDPRIERVTVRRVLSHTTGFPNWSGSKPVWFKTQPGKKFGYSGEGFLYLQKVVEKITKQPLEKYLQQEILTPLGMNSSSLVWKSAYAKTASHGHNRKGIPKAMSKPEAAVSAGSLRTTATDYAQFLIAMMNPGTVDSPNLTEASLDQMLTPQIKISHSIDWGLGWGLETTSSGRFFWHWGDLGTFKSFTLSSRESNTGIVILTNSQNGLRISEKIVSKVLAGKHPLFKFWMIDY
ncbi:serine hydrolase domain-containing protein [Mastigocoleus testarum]|uniref:Serine hydrolase n=1 Tax=Mastigocoleus testarum BC008 TaxID=371196 RepID=A0A0V7ZJL6_9CYAN|nr:serine hydrolase domain-containing protein [Mastigocoleus testarum]KST64415.1 serine hydrolase [Mastigocoleus testarum BC008]